MKSREQGLSLVEVLIAAAILVIGLVPLMRVMMYALETGSRANKMTIATNLARDLAEEIRTQAYAEDYVLFNRASGCDYKSNYPVSSTAQCFGLETGEDPAQTRTKGGRIKVFDDVDDYHGWCRGRDCAGGYKPLETFDGRAYDGSEGYPSYHNFTRRVRVHNLFLTERYLSTFERDPFEQYSPETDYSQFIRRYVFDNWSTELIYLENGTTRATGLSPIKRVEVIATYDGTDTSGIQVVDVSYVVMPIAEF